MKRNEKISNTSAIVASIVSVTAFIIYSWSIFTGKGHPNISSWMVWTFLTILNARSYAKLLNDDWKKALLPIANAAMTIITLAAAIYFGSIKSLSTLDKICFFLGLGAGLIWILTKTTSGNDQRQDRMMIKTIQIILQAAIIIGFIPTFTGVWNYPQHEPWFPWLLWAICFALQTRAVALNPNRKSAIEFLYPVDMLICHGAVFILSLM